MVHYRCNHCGEELEEAIRCPTCLRKSSVTVVHKQHQWLKWSSRNLWIVIVIPIVGYLVWFGLAALKSGVHGENAGLLAIGGFALIAAFGISLSILVGFLILRLARRRSNSPAAHEEMTNNRND